MKSYSTTTSTFSLNSSLRVFNKSSNLEYGSSELRSFHCPSTHSRYAWSSIPKHHAVVSHAERHLVPADSNILHLKSPTMMSVFLNGKSMFGNAAILFTSSLDCDNVGGANLTCFLSSFEFSMVEICDLCLIHLTEIQNFKSSTKLF